MIWFLLFITLAVVLLFTQYKSEMKHLKSELVSNSLVMELSSGTFEYSIIGEGAPVLISHGGAGGYDQGLLTANFHLNNGFKVITVSRFGHLRSDLPQGADARLQADVYAELLDKLGITETSIIGTSGGGPSAIQFAIRHPEKCHKLILSCAVSAYLPKRDLKIYSHPFLYYMVVKYFRKQVLKQIGVTKRLYIQMSKKEKSNLDGLFKSMNPIDLRSDGLVIDVNEWADQNKWEETYDFSKVQCQTLIIHAKDDLVIPYAMAENAHGNINKSELLSLESGGHLKLGHKDLIKTRTSAFITDEK